MSGFATQTHAAGFRKDQWTGPGTPGGSGLWPGGIVPFEFDDNLDDFPARRILAEAAMNAWAAVANITFRPRAPLDVAWVHIKTGDLDLTYVGNFGIDGVGWAPGARLVNISNSMWELDVVIHELGHILGLVHEQNRPDRDTFIRVEWDNVQAGFLDFNYFIDPLGLAYGTYDFDSIMQYEACAASKCANCDPMDPHCRAMTALPGHEDHQATMGTSTTISKLDALTMSFLYPQPDWRFVDINWTIDLRFFYGSFLHPYRTLAEGAASTPENGTLWIQPGSYDESLTLTRKMLLQAPLGGVTIGE